MPDIRLETLVEERQFAGLLQTHSEVFFRLANTLLASDAAGAQGGSWTKKHFFQLISEADALESFLDDYGARYNRTYAHFTEMVASLRWFAYAGYSVSHLLGRLPSYGEEMWSGGARREEAEVDITEGLEFLRKSAIRLLESIQAEADGLGLELTPESFPESNFVPVTSKQMLPRNVGEAALLEEDQRVAEVATKFLQAAEMIASTEVRRIEDRQERHQFFTHVCTEELARVYEATVHNLQSTYDTHIRNTVLEGRDPRLAQLRGHTSGALHLLQAVTYLAHFVERHEAAFRSPEGENAVETLVDRDEVERVAIHSFLLWAHRILQSGTSLTEALLPAYSNLQELELEIAEGFSLHARPAALIVGIVNHHGTPVEMDLGGKRCNAGSILELLVTVGSNPDETLFVFRGDSRPLRDIQLLFLHALGEGGLAGLPEELDYLREE